MSLIDLARDALNEIPLSGIMRERLSLAIDRLAEAEAKIDLLQAENGKLQAQLENARLDHKEAQQELQRLQEEHAEEVRIHETVEFRRGKRTGGVWMAFCPQCHAPAKMWETVRCSLFGSSPGACRWMTLFGEEKLKAIIATL